LLGWLKATHQSQQMSDIEKEFAVHQAVCDQRYKSIEDKLESGKRRMEGIQTQLYIVIAAILFGPGVAADIVKKMLGL
jgi:hypothetical protein